MSNLARDAARAVADVVEGELLASVEIPATPERVFRALASKEVTQWWVRPGVFDTREWTGDVRAGGHWGASGLARGNPYALEGEFTTVDPPRKLVHTWIAVGEPGWPMTVTYHLEKIDVGTRIKLSDVAWGHDAHLGAQQRTGNRILLARLIVSGLLPRVF